MARVCDRCRKPENRTKTVLVDKKDGTEYDLCDICKEAFDVFIATEPSKGTEADVGKQGKEPKEKRRAKHGN